MQTLKLDNDKARRLYPSAAPEFKTILEDSFGKDFFSQKVADRVKTFEDACNELGIDSTTAIPKVATDPLQKDERSIWAYCKLIIIAKALNEGWVPNWKDSSQYKYYPWFDLSSGSGLSYGAYVSQRSSSDVGSRLCFKSRELAEYAGKQFEDLYKKYFLLK
jgi:hypothetical protein